MNKYLNRWMPGCALAALSLVLLPGCGGFEASPQRFSPTKVQASLTETDESGTEQIMCEDEEIMDCGDSSQLTDVFGCLIAACMPPGHSPQEGDGDGRGSPDPNDGGSGDGGNVTQPSPGPAPAPVQQEFGHIKYAAAWKKQSTNTWGAFRSGQTGGTPMTKAQAEAYCREKNKVYTPSTGIQLKSSGRAYICVFIHSVGGEEEVIDYKKGVADALRSTCAKGARQGATTYCSAYNAVPDEVKAALEQREATDMNFLNNRY